MDYHLSVITFEENLCLALFLELYQHLEFLGDSILDLLITRHFFKCYPDIDPGELTDLADRA